MEGSCVKASVELTKQAAPVPPSISSSLPPSVVSSINSSKSVQVPVSTNPTNNNNTSSNQSCIESNSTTSSSSSTTTTPTATANTILDESILADGPKNIAKFVVATHGLATNNNNNNSNNNNQVIQKVVNSPLITVLNTSGPLTVLKSLAYAPVVSTTTPHYTFVNTSTLNVTNAATTVGGVKTPTITVLNCGPLPSPVTVVKALTAQQTQQLQQQVGVVAAAAAAAAAGTAATTTTIITEKAATAANVVDVVGTALQQAAAAAAATNVIENRGHNVFVKNSAGGATDSDSNNIVLSSKFLTGNAASAVINKSTVNGQRSKVKLVTNIRVPGQAAHHQQQQQQQNVVFSQISTKVIPSKYTMTPRPKVLGTNGTTTTVTTGTKYVTKPAALAAAIGGQAIAVAPAAVVVPPPSAVTQQTVTATAAAPSKLLKPVVNSSSVKPMQEKNSRPVAAAASAAPIVTQSVPVQKGLIKTLSSSYMFPKQQQQVAAIGSGVRGASQNKNIPSHIQRTGAGIRTIPPQRASQKFPPTKTNYIGKHAAQAQKSVGHKQHTAAGTGGVGSSVYQKMKPIKPMNSSHIYRHHQQQQIHHHPSLQQQQQQHPSEKQLIFNQVLNAHIVESLKSTSSVSTTNNHNNYNNAFTCPAPIENNKPSLLSKPSASTSASLMVNASAGTSSASTDLESKSDLDTLSLICQAVLLDHNYSCNPNESTSAIGKEYKEHSRSSSSSMVLNNNQSQMNNSALYGLNTKRRMLAPPPPQSPLVSPIMPLSSPNIHTHSASVLSPPPSQQQQSASTTLHQHHHQLHPNHQQQQQHHHHGHHGTPTLLPPSASTYNSIIRNNNSNNNKNTNNTTQRLQKQSANNDDDDDDDDAGSDISDGSERKHDTEGEETDTAPEVEDVKNDEHYGDYVTRCICAFIHDDGYMVQCDKCKVWQHVQCVVKNRQIPDEYLCELCDKSKPIDRQKARLLQQQWLKDRQYVDQKIRKITKLKSDEPPLSDTDSSDNEQQHAPVAAAVTKQVGRSRHATGAGRKKSDGSSGKSVGKKEPQQSATREPVQRRQKRKERKTTKRKTRVQVNKHQQQSHSDEENQDMWTSHLPQLRQWIEKYEEAVTNHYSPELRARISSIRTNGVHMDTNLEYDPTVCKCRVHTQPLTELKYIVTTVQLTAEMPVIELRGKYMLSTQHRSHPGGGSGGGGVNSISGSGGGGSSLTTRQHTQRPGPFLFFYKLHKDNTEVCVDTRTYGNSARFIRRSCRPNAELRHCIEKGVLHLFIVSIATVEKNFELTIKHESHDLAAVGTTQIACACGRPDTCLVNKTTIKKNGEVPEITTRKRRGRRTAAATAAAAAANSLSGGTASAKSQQSLVPAETTLPPPPPPPAPQQTSSSLDQKSLSKDNNILRSSIVNNRTSSPTRSQPPRQAASAASASVATTTATMTKTSTIPTTSSVAAYAKAIKVEKAGESTEIETETKMEIRERINSVKKEIKKEPDDEEVNVKTNDLAQPIVPQLKAEIKKEKQLKEEKPKEKFLNVNSSTASPMSTRRSSYYRNDNHKEENSKDSPESTINDKLDIDINLNATTSTPPSTSSSSKKLSREERKLAAILRAIEQMEKANQKKQENQAKQANRRESEPTIILKDEEKPPEVKVKRRRRRGRARTISTNKRNRLNSTDSYLTSGDENLLSPTDSIGSQKAIGISGKDDGNNINKAETLLLAASFASGSNNILDKQRKSPPPTSGGGDGIESTHSSPESFRLSSACLLVQAAVEPLESGFKFPKTKKGLMNEWLNKVPEPLHSGGSSSTSSPPSSSSTAAIEENNLQHHKTSRNLNLSPNRAQSSPPSNNTNNSSEQQQKGGNAKKRWLRQAISEDHSGDSLTNRSDSPTASITETVAPPKKRRLARESLSSDNTPPTTPTRSELSKSLEPSENSQETLHDDILLTTSFNDIPPTAAAVAVETTLITKLAAATAFDFSTLPPPPPTSTTTVPSVEEKQEVTVIETVESEKKKKLDELPFSSSSSSSSPIKLDTNNMRKSVKRLLDPRLNRDNTLILNNQVLSVCGNVEKTINVLGLDNVVQTTKSTSSSLPDSPVPAKKKLSITEYRERKKLNPDKSDGCGGGASGIGEQEMDTGESQTPEDNSSDSCKMFPVSTAAPNATTTTTTLASSTRTRLRSSSSSGSASSCDETLLSDVTTKAPAFNSEPTELERQTEITTLRLKKVFGLPLDTNNSITSAVHEMFVANSESKFKKANNQLNSFSLSAFSNIASSSSPLVGGGVTIDVSPVEQLQSPSLVEKQQQLQDGCLGSDNCAKIASKDVDHEERKKDINENTKNCEATNVEMTTDTTENNDVQMETDEIEEEKEDDSQKINERLKMDTVSNIFYTPDDVDEDDEMCVTNSHYSVETEDDVEDDEDDEQNNVLTNYVPPFNNPVYPNSNFTSFTSAIDDDSRYQSRNPSPPPDLDSGNSHFH